MSVIQRVVKPITRKGKQVLLKKEPQIVEGAKRALLLHGRKSSQKLRGLLKDLYDFKKPDAFHSKKRNDVTVFENAKPVEDMCRKHDAGLFLIGSHSKKRPDNLVLGRTFNQTLLDMIELYVESYEGLDSFNTEKILFGSKPCLLFNGPRWETQEELRQLKSIFIDYFHREYTEHVRLQGVEHTLSFNAIGDDKILLRSYRVSLKKSGRRTPRVELEEIGPRVNFTLRRSKLPDPDLWKQACKKPKELKLHKKKNIERDELGNTAGRIHLGKQQLDKIQTRKMKGLKKGAGERVKLRNKTRVVMATTITQNG